MPPKHSPERAARMESRLIDRVIADVERCDPDLGLCQEEKDIIRNGVHRAVVQAGAGGSFTSADLRKIVAEVMTFRSRELSSIASSSKRSLRGGSDRPLSSLGGGGAGTTSSHVAPSVHSVTASQQLARQQENEQYRARSTSSLASSAVRSTIDRESAIHGHQAKRTSATLAKINSLAEALLPSSLRAPSAAELPAVTGAAAVATPHASPSASASKSIGGAPPTLGAPSATRIRVELQKQDVWAAQAQEAKLQVKMEEQKRKQEQEEQARKVRAELELQMEEHRKQKIIAELQAKEFLQKVVETAQKETQEDREKKRQIRLKKEQELKAAKEESSALVLRQQLDHKAQLELERKMLEQQVEKELEKKRIEEQKRKEQLKVVQEGMKAHVLSSMQLKKEEQLTQKKEGEELLRVAAEMEAESERKLLLRKRQRVEDAKSTMAVCQSMLEEKKKVESLENGKADHTVLLDVQKSKDEELNAKKRKREAERLTAIEVKKQILSKEYASREEVEHKRRGVGTPDIDERHMTVLPTETRREYIRVGGGRVIAVGTGGGVSPVRRGGSPGGHSACSGDASSVVGEDGMPTVAALRHQDNRQWIESIEAQMELHRKKKLAGHLVTSIARSQVGV